MNTNTLLLAGLGLIVAYVVYQNFFAVAATQTPMQKLAGVAVAADFAG